LDARRLFGGKGDTQNLRGLEDIQFRLFDAIEATQKMFHFV
jgi:hypothetical protein